MEKKINFSVIIPSYNGALKISNLIKALLNQDSKEFEIILILDGSTDDTESIVSKILAPTNITFSIYNKPNEGRSKTRNYGSKLAKADYLIFFDDDMIPENQCINVYKNFHTQYPNSIAVGTQMEDPKSMQTDFQLYKASLSRKWNGNNKNGIKRYSKDDLHLTAANFSLPKSIFDLLNGFEERLSDVEDFELGTRAIDLNIPIYFVPNANAWHNDLVTCQSYIVRQREYNNAYLNLLKYRPELKGQFKQTLPYKTSMFRKFIYWIFSSPFWAKTIDKQPLFIKAIPKKIRYKLYDIVVWSQGKVFTK
jgi:glycosyltransferase involved in cell wall biosynthesis